MKDVQRSKVYAAEREVWGEWRVILNSLDEIQAFADKVTRSKLYAELKPYGLMSKRVIVDREASDRARSWSWGGYTIYYRGNTHYAISISKAQRFNWVVLHEIAHCAAPQSSKHDDTFCIIYIALVEKFIGAEAGMALRRSFNKHGVSFSSQCDPRNRKAA